MQYIRGMEFYRNEHRTAITLGKFDGLHCGHERLVRRVVEHQKNDGVDSVVFAFDMTPLYQKQNLERKYLLTNEERAGRLDGRVDYFVECPFVESISEMEAETFIREVLVGRFHVKYIVVGTDFHFGHQKKGDADMLEKYSALYDYQVEVIEKKCHKGREISSTSIREELEKGELELVRELLGYPYTISGEVIHGRKLGRTIGIPTLNIRPHAEKLLPPNGVYVSRVLMDGRYYDGICNIGVKPTVVSGGETLLESYLFDYTGNAYGKQVSVSLYRYRRAERRFASVEELKCAMEEDIAYGRQYFRKMPERK